jgi:hypothetical protein
MTGRICVVAEDEDEPSTMVLLTWARDVMKIRISRPQGAQRQRRLVFAQAGCAQSKLHAVNPPDSGAN